MSAKPIDGRKIAAGIRDRVRDAAAGLVRSNGVRPGLAAVLVGDDPASATYVRMKRKACEEAGLASRVLELPVETRQEELLARVATLNADPEVHGILVQLPLPPQIDERAVVRAVDPDKDVDGFHPLNVGRVALGELEDAFVPATPAGILRLLDETGVELRGADAVVIGRSAIVGRPTALLLLHRSATVTVCHSRTRDLASHTRRADVLVAAVGMPGFVTADMVKPGATVIDVGINRVQGADGKGRLVGDVDFDEVSRVAGSLTPVPGGVGPMTIAMLLENTLAAARRAAGTPGANKPLGESQTEAKR
ncbi:MAG TPA: bifunctional methylenetetrahydrofolate dehydrogenase/methenyltetrahydrofolate cyclohydrolase FolD [Gemmatimonadota bacterium]|nr:bifunctional methylenetetrahydrofolate dehydrogenase/methenyltetrahydrofolate cyclohydrolase FolD [Gemmatimonadota bacterium]